MKAPKRHGPALWARSLYRGYRRRRDFEHIQTWCMFIGYPRSGHTIVGALLDAHPDIVLATGTGVADLFSSIYTPRQVYSILVDRAHYLAVSDADRGGYHYDVPNQWQGRYRTLSVIGEKMGKDGLEIAGNDRLWQRLQGLAGGNLRFLHVLRNPYDTISSMRQRRNLTLERKRDIYFEKTEQAVRAIATVGAENVLNLRHEHFVADPSGELARTCAFLGIDAPPDYLADCASIVRRTPNRSRFAAPWTPELIADVAARIKAFPFLDGYEFGAPGDDTDQAGG